MAIPSGSIPFSGLIYATDETDTYAVTTEELNKGGYRTVADATERLAITPDRRKVGMLVKQTDTGAFWTLTGGILDANWELQIFSSADPYGNGIADWVTATLYKVNYYVRYNNQLYRCKTQHISSVFATDIANWDIVSEQITDWVTATLYRINSYVRQSNLIYKCITAHTSSVFATDSANWEAIKNSAVNITFDNTLATEITATEVNTALVQLNTRLKNEENKVYEIEYFEIITSGTSGTIANKPVGATIILDQYEDLGDCAITKVDTNNRPISEFAKDSSGVIISSTFNLAGNYVLSGTPSVYPIALLYQFQISSKDYDNVDPEFVINSTEPSLLTRDIPTTTLFPAHINDSLNLGTGRLKSGGVDFNTSLANPTYAEGKVFYDNTKKALSYYNNEADVTVNLGQELLIAVRNETGSAIPNGAVVYPSGFSGGKVLVGLALASDKEKCRLIGVATHSIENNSDGYVTKFGEVADVDTSAFTSGDIIYLSATVAGAFTKNKPTTSNFITRIGSVKIVNATTGSIVIDSQTSDYTVETLEETGWSKSNLPTIAFTDVDRTLTITPTAVSFCFYQYGDKFCKTTDSIAIPDIEGLNVIYYNLGTLAYLLNPTSTQIEVLIKNNPLVAYVYWDATNKSGIYVGYELHKTGMDTTTHNYLHFAFGMRYLSGLSPNTIVADGLGSSNASAQFGTDSGAIVDEDIYFSIPAVAPTTGLPIAYLIGTQATPSLRLSYNAGFSVLTTGTGRLAYNQLTGGNYQLTEVPNGNFALYHIIAINENASNKRIFAFMGQAIYTTVGNARAGAQTELASLRAVGILPQEIKAVATFIYETNNTYTNAVKSRIRTISTGVNFVDWRTTYLNGSSGGISGGVGSTIFPDDMFKVTNATDVSKVMKFDVAGVTTGQTRTITIPDSSGTIALSTGLLGGQTIIGGTLTTEALTIRSNATDLTTGTVNFLDTLQSNNTIVGRVSTLTGSAVFDGGVAIRKNLRIQGGVVTNFYFAGIPQYQMNRINGSTASATKILSGDVIGQVSFNGYTDTLNSTDTGAYIRAIATGDYDSGTNKPTDVIIATASATGVASEAMRITSLQRVGIGFTDPAVPLETTTAIRITRIANNAILQINRINGTRDARTAVLSGDIIGDINFTGSYDATTNVTTGAVIQAVATNNWSNTVRSADIIIKTAPVTGTVVEIARFTGIGGYFGIGTPLPLSKQHTVGVSQNASGNAILTLSTGTGLSTDESLYFGIYDGNYAWIQAVKQGTANRPLLLNPNGGNVGVGLLNPVFKTEVYGALASTTIGASSSVALGATSGGGVTVYTPNIPTAGDQRLGAMFFGAYTSGTTISLSGRIACFSDEAWSGTAFGTYMAFYTSLKTSTTVSERMRITSGGNLLVGTTIDMNAGVTSTTPMISVAKNGASPFISATGFSNASGGLALGCSDGTLVGTYIATPDGRILGTLAFNGVNSSNTVSYASYIEGVQDGVANATGIAGRIEFHVSRLTDNANITAMTIKNSGNVGIGILNPLVKLAIQSSTANSNVFQVLATGGVNRLIQIANNNASGDCLVDLGNNSETGTYDASVIRLNTNGESYFTGGNFHIGLKTSTQTMHIKNRITGHTSLMVEGNGSDNVGQTFVKADTTALLQSLVYGSTSVGTLIGNSTAGGAYIITNSIDALTYPTFICIGTINATPVIFGTSNAERMRIANDGSVNIGTTYKFPTAQVSIADQAFAIVGATVTTDNTNKNFRVGCGHYINAEEPLIALFATSQNDENIVSIGGGTSLGNATMSFRVYTALDRVTLTGTKRFEITNDGRIFGTALHNNSGAVTGTTDQYIASGTYTPTLYNTTNVDSSIAYVTQWIRVGNVVTVSGRVLINLTATTTATVLGMSLPIASNIASSENLGGVCTTENGDSMQILGDLTNNRATFQSARIQGTSNTDCGFTFTYVVL